MEKIIDRKIYRIPSNLTVEQERIYCHIIDWKRDNITTERGTYKGHEYDALFPGESSVPVMLYPSIINQWKEMQNSSFAYKTHKFANNHAISSQTACINLFMPILLSKDVNKILPLIPGCPSDFKCIARDKLFHGFCFEYWGQDIKQGKGLLNDHTSQAGTDADVAIAYYNSNRQLCIWLIEHKLSEKEFTKCGAFKSKANRQKSHCYSCSISDMIREPGLCYYISKGYRYWEILKEEVKRFEGKTNGAVCPFKSGLNQLWRNQMLGFALLKSGTYQAATFSVCRHARNTMLDMSIGLYKALTVGDEMFTCFTNDDVLIASDTNSHDILEWRKWYAEVYCF